MHYYYYYIPCHFRLICSFILNKAWAFLIQCVLLSRVLCFTFFFFFIFFSSCLHSLSIQLWHLLAGSLSVCTLSAGWGWLGQLPLHTFITWTIFMCAGCFFRAVDERDLERCTRCVGSAWSLECVFHLTWIWSRSVFCHNFFPPCVWYVSQPVFCIPYLLFCLSSYFYRPFSFYFLQLSYFIFLLFSSHNQLWVFLLSLL